jgi:predicted HTH domain antitoxin
MTLVQVDQMTSRDPNGGVTVSFPNSVLIAAREDRTQFERRVLLHTLGSLYAQGRISSGLAAQVLGCDRWDFYRLLTENGIPVLDYADDEQTYEAETSRKLAANVSSMP